MEKAINELIMKLFEKESYFVKMVNNLWSKWEVLKDVKWHNQIDLKYFDENWIENVNKLDDKYRLFIERLGDSSQISEDYERFVKKELGEHNLDPYGMLNQHTETSINELFELKRIATDFLWDENMEQKIWGVENILSNLESYLQFYSSKISSLLIFNNISQINGNTVLIGANGSGKSSFARQLKRLHSENITIISAQHLLFYNEKQSLNFQENPLDKVRVYQSSDKLPNAKDIHQYSFKQEITEEFDNLVNSLIADLNIKANKLYIDNQKEESELIQTIEIWNSIIEHRKLFIDSNWLRVRDEDVNDVYNFNQLSDGEKAVFYYIAQILIAKQGNYIVIDEPENHINLAICNLLWDKLEEVRNDCTFIYLTHNVDFAVSRINTTILWNKSFNVPDSWEIEAIPSNIDIPDELLVEIMGSRKNVLFCEGEKSSLDYKLYSALFEDRYTIIPVRGHIDVINYCGAYNEANLFHGKAIGLIDKDYHKKEQIESWRKKGVYTLPYSEIENMFFGELVLEQFRKKSLITVKDIDNFKSDLFKDMKKNMDSMAVIIVRDRINIQMKNNLLKSKKSIELLTEELESVIATMAISDVYTEIQEKFLKIVEEKNYEQYLEYSNVKGKLFSFANNHLGTKKFEDKVLLQLRNDDEFREEYRKKYFKEI